MKEALLKAVDQRYTPLAGSCCSLSCGGALNYAQSQEGEVGLDLGCGRGNDVIRLAEQVGPTGFAWGLDLSEGMVEKARKNLEKFGVNNARIVQGDLEKLPFEDESVDLVISNCVLNHAYNKKDVWKEIFRVLVPGGRFVVSDIYSLEAVPEEYREDPAAVAECWAGSVERGVYLNQVSSAGFHKIDILDESEPYTKAKIEVVSWTLRGWKMPSLPTP
ncbi:MAG: methyltransferase domain-containing protein [Spirochaetales bacterium]|nr:methyltransferase domain-containing protein [Spirochaetales bacterium]